MRFADFLKATVTLCAGCATALATAFVLEAAASNEPERVYLAMGWWLMAGVFGGYLGRSNQVSVAISRLLKAATVNRTLPTLSSTRVLINRLWPIFLTTFVALGLLLIWPQIAGITVGFLLIWALSWRKQALAVKAVENRDGCMFYTDRTSPLAAIKLIRTPGFKDQASYDLESKP